MLSYFEGRDHLQDWIISERDFNCDFLRKSESIFALGNGYLGLRSATEEKYLNEHRGFYVSGLFNKFPGEVSELGNLPDILNMNFIINGQRFNLNYGEIKSYDKQLNLKTGELIRKITWISPNGDKVYLDFYRFVSMDNKHLMGSKVEISSNSSALIIEFESGIDGKVTNSGVQHFTENKKRIYDQKYLRYTASTTDSAIDIDLLSTHNFYQLNQKTKTSMVLDRRFVGINKKITLDKRDCLVIEKISSIYTSLDELPPIDQRIEEIKTTYDSAYQASKDQWEALWEMYDVKIFGNHFDQLAIRFSIYHMLIMAPVNEKFGIGAKGLTGEGYKGHSFWDTEIFILPFFIYTNPNQAKALLKYRYHLLDVAKQKAKDHGYEGAMYPWEAAATTEGDQTPEYAIVDTMTGKPTKVLSGKVEQHISADVSYAVCQYFELTKDFEFMKDYGFEIVFEIANFWSSRLEFNEAKGQYEITGVIGPDEYKESAENNAFTNYMAHFSLKKAIEYSKLIKHDQYDCINRQQWIAKVNKIYLPQPNEDKIIAQDDSYLGLKTIDIEKYKDQNEVDLIFKDYNLKDLNNYQVTKQADVVMLLNLLENRFDDEVIKKNFEFYESKTLHDSSLSLSMHCLLAAKLGMVEKAYELFEQASRIDLGQSLNSSNNGIHAASLGGLWQAIVFGFSGLKVKDNDIKINPNLPLSWMSLEYKIKVNNKKYRIIVTSSDYDVVRLN